MSDATTRFQEKMKQAGPVLGISSACLVVIIVVLVLLFGLKVHHLKAQVADGQKQLTEAKAENAKTQTELGKAQAAVKDLQAQLDKAKSQEAYVQAQLDLAKVASTQTLAQLDKDAKAAAEMKAQLDKHQAESTELHTKLSEATANSSQLLTQLDQAKMQSIDLQTRLQKAENDLAKAQPRPPTTHPMPVNTTFEKTSGGRSFTLHINNLNAQPVHVEVTITGGTGKTRTQSNVIGVGATQNVEKLAIGENVVITSDGYDALNLMVH